MTKSIGNKKNWRNLRTVSLINQPMRIMIDVRFIIFAQKNFYIMYICKLFSHYL